MKKLIKCVELLFFEDEQTGEWGLAHEETYSGNESFNAFWNGIGIFHDVFEHSHEYTNKYFQDHYAMNVGGEMTAMGAMYYYQYTLGIGRKRLFNPNWYGNEYDLMRITTQDMIQEAVNYGYTNFGRVLNSNVPKQSPIDDGEFEYQIEKYWKECKTFHYKDDYSNVDEKNSSEAYKKSLSFRKIADLHRYGYRLAEKFVPKNWENRETLIEFIDLWNDITKVNSAEDLAQNYKGINFYIYKEKDKIYWKAKMLSKYPQEIEDITIKKESNKYISVKDYYKLEFNG